MKITKALKSYLQTRMWIKGEMSDPDIQAVITDKLASGELDTGTLHRLVDEQAGLKALLSETVDAAVKAALQAAGIGTGTGTKGGTGGGTGPTPTQVFGGGGTVTRPSERHSTKRHAAIHAKSGQPVLLADGTPLERPSEADKALLGCWFKTLARKAGQPVNWSEHDEQLWQELVTDHPWTDGRGPEPVTVTGAQNIKGLLDDSISGGAYINPTVFDDAILVNLLMLSELAPYVDTKDIGKGRVVRTGLVGRPSSVWGIPDSTAMPLFDTTGLITPLDTPVMDLKGAVEFGRDLAEDVSLNVGDLLIEGITESMLAQLDKAIAVGDGTTMPLGLATTSGIVTVPSTNGAGGPITVGDLESLLFSVKKPYRAPAFNPSFVGSEVAFRRARAIPVAVGYNTRVFGNDLTQQDYTISGYPFRANNDLPDNYLIFVALKKYRLYRRKGIQTRIVTEGSDLALRNVNLLVALARFGGRLLDSYAAALMSDLAA